MGTSQSTYIPRAPQCMSPRRNWGPPNPPTHARLPSHPPPPPPDQKVGRHTRLWLRGWGSSSSDDWRKSLGLFLLWLAIYRWENFTGNVPITDRLEWRKYTKMTTAKARKSGLKFLKFLTKKTKHVSNIRKETIFINLFWWNEISADFHENKGFGENIYFHWSSRTLVTTLLPLNPSSSATLSCLTCSLHPLVLFAHCPASSAFA